jgi:ectoine hydroxylase-related dioxygenase (phytanoyl-CoA dioxygenase family)
MSAAVPDRAGGTGGSMLSAADMEFFSAHGFLGPFELPPALREELMPEAYLRRVRQVLDSGRLGRDKARNQHLYSSSLVRLASHPEILDKVRAMLGEDVLLWVAHILARKSGTGGQVWHSDSINQYVRGIHVSLALTDMTRKNGCLSLIRGTHLYRTSLWAYEQSKGLDRNDTDAIVKLADESAPWHAPHKVELMEITAGQYFFTWGGLWHGVGPNNTNETRMACVARYVRPDFQCRDHGMRDDRIHPGELQPCLLVHGRDDFKLNDLRSAPAEDIFA